MPPHASSAEPNDRASAFFVDGNWMSPAPATGADHSSYGPGERGRFTFLIRAPLVLTFTLDAPDVMTLVDLDAAGAPRPS